MACLVVCVQYESIATGAEESAVHVVTTLGTVMLVRLTLIDVYNLIRDCCLNFTNTVNKNFLKCNKPCSQGKSWLQYKFKVFHTEILYS